MGAIDPTLPPSSSTGGLVCPVCRGSFDPAEATYTSELKGALPRCPKHGLAYVEVSELAGIQADPLLGKTVADRFTVLAKLGSGSMGAVYLARQEAVARDVALKIVHPERAYDPETRSRFEREAKATSSLVSPYTVTVFDFGEAGDGSWFLAMELLRGESLGDRLRRVGRLGVGDAVKATRQALQSLSEAHGKGIVHRDLKPDNLFLTRVPDASGGDTDVCKVLDFGIAKVMHIEKKIDQLETQAGTVFGTPRYMSPEQAQGNSLDARSDIYSLGVLLYQMLSGRAPFVDEDAVVVMAQHIKDEPPVFDEVAPGIGVPAAIERVVRRALAKDPDDRPQTAEQFAGALIEAAERSGVLASGVHDAAGISSVRSVVAALPLMRPTLKRRLAIAGGVLVMLALFTVGFFLFRSQRKVPPAVATDKAAPSPRENPEKPAAGREMKERAPEPEAAKDAAVAVKPKKPVPRGSRRGAPAVKSTVSRPALGVAPVPAPPKAVPSPPAPTKKPNERYGRFE